MNFRKPLLLASTALLLSACERDTVTHVRVGKSLEAPAAPEMAGPPGMGAAPPGMGEGAVPPNPAAGLEAADRLQWTLPAGWTAKMETGMRYATIKPSGAGKVEVSVVMLPGPAGGELANVNRWRGQLGLAPIDDAQLASLRKPMETSAGALELFDMVSEGTEKSRTLAAVLATESGNSWFVKMTGGAEAVRARQAEFLRLLSSLRFGDGEKP